jgi:hypothetical protein
MNTLPAIGTHVRVPWGAGCAEGDVVDAYDSGFGAQVVVAVALEGLDEPMTVTFHASAVEPAALRREEVLAA